MKRSLTMLTLTGALLVSASALAQTMDKNVKIGVLNDQSSLYADITGAGSTLAAQMAVEDSGLNAKGWKIEVIAADHQNKADVGTNIARQWLDVEKVDMIADVPTSSVALAINNLVKEKNRVFMSSGAAASDLTTTQCSPNTVHWTYDTYLLANGTGKALVKAGGDTWFFLTADYAFGHALERDTAAVVTANGGKVAGVVRHPLNTSDFSSFLLQAQASKAKIVGLANAGGDTTNSIKQAAEFGIVAGGQKLAGLLMFISDVHALGLKTAQGLNFTETFYWDLNDQTRAFSKKFQERMKNKAMPSMVQAGVYGATLHYLKTLEALGGNPHEGLKVVAKMKELPTDDPLFGKGTIRADGRKIHPGYLFEVKKPSESKGPWDYYKLVSTIPAEEAFTPVEKSPCGLLKKS
jgi:branched-chain amino acid transport system substrate-binding protein